MSGGREVAPDGSPVVLYLRLPAGDEARIIDSAVPRGAQILELGAGAGRVTHALTALGHRLVAVDESAAMLRWVRGAETVAASIEELDLDRRFDAVVLASHLVNTSDDGQRSAFLRTCARHVDISGIVLIEHHPADWAESVVERTVERAGVRLALTEVRRHRPYVSAVMVYEIEGATFRQPFTARVLSPAELDAELRGAGLETSRQLSPTWTEARLAR